MEVLKDKESWTKILDTHFQDLIDVYFEYEYFDLYAKSFKVIPEAYFWEDDNIKIFWSHLIRSIDKIELFKDYNYNDLVTPYGYGGPLVIKKTENLEAIKISLESFMKIYFQFAIEQNYVCEFIRFHPIIKNWESLGGLINIEYLNDTVLLDLTQSYEEICQNMAKKTRYYTRKALNEFKDIQITENPSESEINDFTLLYNKTMEKNQAVQKYFFTNKFIADHYKFDNLLIYCRDVHKVIGAEAIFLKGTYTMHYHLSATNYDFQYPPSRAVLWKAIEWAKKNGFKWFYFGGGVSRNDSLFHFKKGFSKTYLPFYIGDITFNKKIYSELCKINPLSGENPNYFPSYRIGYDKTII